MFSFLRKLHFPCGLAGKESACNAGDLSLIPGLGRSPGEGKGYPLQYSGLENSMDLIPWGHKESDTTEQLSLTQGNSILFSIVSVSIYIAINSVRGFSLTDLNFNVVPFTTFP